MCSGAEKQKQRWLWPLLSGEEFWRQLFSEGQRRLHPLGGGSCSRADPGERLGPEGGGDRRHLVPRLPPRR